MENRVIQVDTQENLYANVHHLVSAAIRRAKRSAENASLAGEPAAPVYDDLLEELATVRDSMAEYIQEVTELKDHRHEWNENEFCNICGADGRA